MNHQAKKECFKTSVGGQALMEGIMMRGPKQICCAVRRPDGSIETKLDPIPARKSWMKIPIVRGAVSMIESLVVGYRYMMYSAQVSMGEEYDEEEEETAFEKWVGEHLGEKAEKILLTGAAVVGGLGAILLFTILPTLVTAGVGHFIEMGRWPRVILELPELYVPDLPDEGDRACVPLPRGRAQDHRLLRGRGRADGGKRPQIHPVPPPVRHQLSDFGGHHQRIFVQRPALEQHGAALLKLLLLPVVMGISYEALKWCGRSDSLLSRIVRQPGLWVQRLTVFEPDDSMIEVAIEAVKPVLPERPEEGRW